METGVNMQDHIIRDAGKLQALIRADLWNPAKPIERSALPSTGSLLKDLSDGRVGGAEYGRDLPARVQDSLY